MLRARGPDIRHHAAGSGAGGAEGGAAEEHEQNPRAQHHRLDVRDHRNRHTPAAGDHGPQQVELPLDHSGLGLFLQNPLLLQLVAWEQEQEVMMMIS